MAHRPEAKGNFLNKTTFNRRLTGSFGLLLGFYKAKNSTAFDVVIGTGAINA